MHCDLANIQDILSDQDPQLTERLAQEAARITRQYFGRAISLYAPLYISNYCSCFCTYCGFNNHNHIPRLKLTADQIEQEMQKIAHSGIENILILTGESYQMTPLPYLKEAVMISKRYFSSTALEIHPLEEAEYKELYQAGADSVTLYQETYNRRRYAEVHLAGKKKDYDFRYQAPERIAKAGFRQISLGVLLGLSDLAEDLFALFSHVRWMEQTFPGVEYSLSFPRLHQIKGKDFALSHVDDIAFIKAICLARIYFPRIGINLSTRESSKLRDHAIELGVTRISAGSNTSVGGYSTADPERQNPQFDIADNRSVAEMLRVLKDRRFDPVLTDWRRIDNT